MSYGVLRNRRLARAVCCALLWHAVFIGHVGQPWQQVQMCLYWFILVYGIRFYTFCFILVILVWSATTRLPYVYRYIEAAVRGEDMTQLCKQLRPPRAWLQLEQVPCTFAKHPPPARVVQSLLARVTCVLARCAGYRLPEHDW